MAGWVGGGMDLILNLVFNFYYKLIVDADVVL